MELNCETCEFLKQCEKEFGELGNPSGDDCGAVIGTHFCVASWKPFFELCKCKNISA